MITLSIIYSIFKIQKFVNQKRLGTAPAMQGQPDGGAPGIPAEGVAQNEGGLDQPVEEENANNNEEMDDNAQNEGNEH